MKRINAQVETYVPRHSGDANVRIIDADTNDVIAVIDPNGIYDDITDAVAVADIMATALREQQTVKAASPDPEDTFADTPWRSKR